MRVVTIHDLPAVGVSGSRDALTNISSVSRGRRAPPLAHRGQHIDQDIHTAPEEAMAAARGAVYPHDRRH